MAKQSILTADDKAKVKKAIPTSSSTNKIITAGVARVYQASADSASYVHCDAVRGNALISMGVDGTTLGQRAHWSFARIK